MRNTFRSYACAFSLIAALAVPLSAATTSGDDPGDFLMKVKNALIVVFEEAKIVIPIG
jgi:hypothetical protein